MKRDVDLFLNTKFDIIIVGGGITGACLAHDASLRGLRVALLEKKDFGMSTSAASSKLLHGGIRYLQQLKFAKVRESARERCIFQVIAPHLTCHVPFLIPTIQGSLMKGVAAMRLGMLLYRMLCTNLKQLIADDEKRIPNGRFYTRAKAITLVPLLAAVKGMNGVHSLFESHMYNSERMTLSFLKTATTNGAHVANHVKVIRFLREEDRITGVLCQDKLSGKEFSVRGKIVANAAGPFISQLNHSMQNVRLKKDTTGFSKGVHIVTRQICSEFALAISSSKKTEGLVTRGGRHFFVIPWRGRSLIGTTNVPYEGDLDELSVTRKDVSDFLADINGLLPEIQLKDKDVYYAFTGLYPLVSEEIKKDTYQGTGTYQLVDHQEVDGVKGVVSVLGAKYTTARIVAEKAVDLLLMKLNREKVACRTSVSPLVGGGIENLSAFVAAKQKKYQDLLASETIQYLVTVYGSELDTVLELYSHDKSLFAKLSSKRETIVAEIHYAVEKEMAYGLCDMIFSRTGLGTIGHPGSEVLLQVAEIMAAKLGWDLEKIDSEMDKVEAQYDYLKEKPEP